MHVKEIKKLAERKPFRPFAVRLTNGSEYDFKDPKDIGAPRNYRLIMHFGEEEAVRIDTDSIVAVIER